MLAILGLTGFGGYKFNYCSNCRQHLYYILQKHHPLNCEHLKQQGFIKYQVKLSETFKCLLNVLEPVSCVCVCVQC